MDVPFREGIKLDLIWKNEKRDENDEAIGASDETSNVMSRGNIVSTC